MVLMHACIFMHYLTIIHLLKLKDVVDCPPIVITMIFAVNSEAGTSLNLIMMEIIELPSLHDMK